MAEEASDVVVVVMPRVTTRPWTAGLPTPLVAVIVSRYVPVELGGGVPWMAAVPLALGWKTRPVGKVPDSLSTGVGEPVAETVKVLYVPGVTCQVDGLVMTGVCPESVS